jgi:arylsulfatase A-like enzyme
MVLLVLAFASLTHAADRKPNVLFIVADQWRAQAFGFAGDPNVKTPHIDKLAAESVNFVNAVSGCPVCTPMRASLFTGQRPLTHGAFINDVQLPLSAVTLSQTLRDAGYMTGAIGKWHIDGGNRSEFIPVERRRGFEYWKVLECTHAYNKSAYFANLPEKLQWAGYDAFAQTVDAQQFMTKHAHGDRPFALFLMWGPPHDPYDQAPAKYKAMYEPAKLKLRPNVPAEMEAWTRKNLAGYYAHCTALDDAVAQLRQTLADLKIADNTILVFTADHGDMLGSQNATHKQRPYDESIRIPSLWHFPAVLGSTGKQLTAPINAEDLMPTLLGLCGVAIPKTVEGLDYSAYMKGGSNPGDDATLITCPSPFGQFTRDKGGREYRGVRTIRYTYVRDLNGPWLLYDNQTDPYQQHNLVGVPGSEEQQAKLDALLQAKLKASHDEFLPGGAYIKKWGYPVRPNGTMPYKP